jgi:solute carrier family 25 protein 16
MVPYAGLSFSTFEHIKKYLLNHKIKSLTMESTRSSQSNDNSGKYYELTVVGKLICGALTGVLAQTVTYPLDVVRRHMQLVTMFNDSAVRL